MKNKKEIENFDQNNEFDVRKNKFWKFWTVLFALIIGILVVIVRLFYIQIINQEKYYELAKKQQQIKKEIIPQRGNIYDRNGNLVASSIKTVTIAVDPTVLKKKDSLAILIEKNIGISKKSILEKINSAKGQYVELCRRVSPDKINEIRKFKDIGLILKDEPTRYYNYSSIGSQLIGCVSTDNKGLSGIELQFDSLLKGNSGYMIMYRDAKQRLRPALNLPNIEPENGANIYLTLDIELQKIVEFELMQGVINSQATSGTIVALNPKTGELLACASYPGYNPNLPATYSSEGMRIRSIADVYEPGSTFKSITAASGIEEKLVKPTDIYNGYSGLLEFLNVSIKDEHPLGVTTFQKGFESSSNIILSQLALKIPDHKFYKYIRDFGFGLKTGIDLPGEISGRTPKFNLINAMDKRFLGFGYGIMATPIQLAIAYTVIANGGKMMKPYLVNKIEKNEQILKEFKPQFIRKTISEETAKSLTDLLVGVVQNGTGTKAYVKDLKIAGKTGTAQLLVSGLYSKSNHLASFVGFYPANNPKICMLVLIDRPKTNSYGGSVAAPVFKNIALRWTSIFPELLDDSEDENKNKTNKQKFAYIPNLVGLTVDDADVIIKELGLKSNLESTFSSGIIVSQFPKSGTKVTKNSSILLTVNDLNDANIANSNTENSNSNLNSNSSGNKPKLPKVEGLSLRRAISVLHNAGFKAKVDGNGTVIQQKWETNKNNEYNCVLICK